MARRRPPSLRPTGYSEYSHRYSECFRRYSEYSHGVLCGRRHGTTPSALPAPDVVLGVLLSVLGVLTRGTLRATPWHDAVRIASCCTGATSAGVVCDALWGTRGYSRRYSQGTPSRGTQYLRRYRRPSCASCVKARLAVREQRRVKARVRVREHPCVPVSTPVRYP